MRSFWDKIIGSTGSSDYPPKLQKQKIILLVGIMVLGIILILIGNNKAIQKNKNEKGEEKIEPDLYSCSLLTQEEENLALRLKKMLSQVEGAGKVEVIVRLASSKRDRYAINSTTSKKVIEEKDQGGGTRSTTENTGNEQLVVLREGQKEVPVIEEEQAARLTGILVVAEGARDAVIKANLFRAVQVALGAEPQKILVLSAEEEK